MDNSTLIITRVIPLIMIIMGTGILYIWTTDILSGKFSGQGNFFRWKENKIPLWPHIMAEYLTAMGLIVGGICLSASFKQALPVSFIALGAVIYSAVNSTGWVLAEKGRLVYGVPIWVSLVAAVISVILLIMM